MTKPIRTALMAAAAVALTAGAASAQGWMSIDERQDRLESRIEAGIRSGDLSRAEARQLRMEFSEIASLEARYRMNGLSPSEMADLDQRFDRLATQVRMERRDWERRGDNRRDYARGDNDRRDYARNDDWGRWFGGANWRDNGGQWVSINRRQAQLERRINQGIRSGQLTATEAARLRADYNALLRVEARYRRDGFSRSEIADLDRRFDTLAAKIRFERRDRDRQYGYNNYRR
jgi:hypothetical protein